MMIAAPREQVVSNITNILRASIADINLLANSNSSREPRNRWSFII